MRRLKGSSPNLMLLFCVFFSSCASGPPSPQTAVRQTDTGHAAQGSAANFSGKSQERDGALGQAEDGKSQRSLGAPHDLAISGLTTSHLARAHRHGAAPGPPAAPLLLPSPGQGGWWFSKGSKHVSGLNCDLQSSSHRRNDRGGIFCTCPHTQHRAPCCVFIQLWGLCPLCFPLLSDQ